MRASLRLSPKPRHTLLCSFRQREEIIAKDISGARRIYALLAEYGESHQDSDNKLIRWIAVPVIAWTALGAIMVAAFPGWAEPALYQYCDHCGALAILYYITLSLPLAIGMAAFAFAYLAYEANLSLPFWRFALALLAVAWVFQFIGHKLEGKKPSFFKDIQFLLIGPAWLMHFLFRRLGIPY